MHAPPPGTHTVLSGTQAPLPGPAAALVGLAALAIVMIPFLWPLVDHFDTMAHEGAHAIVASAMGFPLLGVTIDQDSSGATGYLGPENGLRRLLTSFAGYLGPSASGLCAAKLIETSHDAQHADSPSPAPLGTAMDRGHAPSCRCRREMAGLAVLSRSLGVVGGPGYMP
jgi:hypothetical protein